MTVDPDFHTAYISGISNPCIHQKCVSICPKPIKECHQSPHLLIGSSSSNGIDSFLGHGKVPMIFSFKKAIIPLLISIFLSFFCHSISFIWCPAMGNALRFLYAKCCQTLSQESDSLGPHGVTTATVGVTAIAHDLFQFDITSQVPEGLSQHVVSSKKAQANWYKKLLQAWKEAKPPPKTPEEAARLIIQTLKNHKKADVEGLLSFYSLPLPQNLAELDISGAPSSWSDGVKFELKTLPVDAKAVADGDTITVYVDTKDPRESANVPRGVHEAAIQRSKARAVRDYTKADELQKQIVDAGYRVINGPNNEDVLARKYRIRLRGIDAPESSMPFGKEAKEELTKLVQGKCLKVLIYGEDRYGRCVGDIYCNKIFVQEFMLKKGLAWHYTAYDQRPELASWEQDARAARSGLWASSNPEKPWEWRKERRNGA